ncbi:MAG: lytic transglycosylase domain-containing protein [Marinospirillum sp.]|uniref:lytic transglycosylase domain-containing protein n=1 Tax=Marinospirillum sp. TaxID=2183934 RepID=UPI0019DE9093|nr:lytic transglycosylase domain-containing protein [Marinospirillum sp.]MBE0506274.1 lytic transglycosylase domain-containing protein [Marinospirillum sp.]
MTLKFTLFFLALAFFVPASAAGSLPGALFQLPSHDCLHKPLRGTPEQRLEFRQCLDHASRVFSISPSILVSIKRAESGLDLDPSVTNHNTDGTTDLSLMQVNYEVWSEELRRIGISLPREAYHDVCNNLMLSGWILRRHLDRFGGDAFEAVGRYHSGTPHLKRIYQTRLAEQARHVVAGCSQ